MLLKEVIGTLTHRGKAVGIQRFAAICTPNREVLEETIPDSTFNSDGSPPEQQENKCPLFKPPVYCILLWQPEKTATGFEMLRTLDDMASCQQNRRQNTLQGPRKWRFPERFGSPVELLLAVSEIDQDLQFQQMSLS